jgi:nucleoside-diphosphate-sugar epimerase
LLPYAPDIGVMTWSHVDDVVAAHEAAATRGVSGQNYILGGAEADLFTVLGIMTDLLGIPLATRVLPYDLLMRYARVQAEIGETFGEATIYTPEVMDVFAATYRCDDRRARDELGYRSRPLQDMVADSHAWLVSEKLL